MKFDQECLLRRKLWEHHQAKICFKSLSKSTQIIGRSLVLCLYSATHVQLGARCFSISSNSVFYFYVYVAHVPEYYYFAFEKFSREPLIKSNHFFVGAFRALLLCCCFVIEWLLLIYLCVVASLLNSFYHCFDSIELLSY